MCPDELDVTNKCTPFNYNTYEGTHFDNYEPQVQYDCFNQKFEKTVEDNRFTCIDERFNDVNNQFSTGNAYENHVNLTDDNRGSKEQYFCNLRLNDCNVFQKENTCSYFEEQRFSLLNENARPIDNFENQGFQYDYVSNNDYCEKDDSFNNRQYNYENRTNESDVIKVADVVNEQALINIVEVSKTNEHFDEQSPETENKRPDNDTVDLIDNVDDQNTKNESFNDGSDSVIDLKDNCNEIINANDICDDDVKSNTENCELLEANSNESGKVKIDRDDKKVKSKKKGFKRIVLSIEEQKRDLEHSRKSKKYVDAEFKCYSCALGFLFKDTYQAHMMRHEESNGEYRCEICTLRFSTHSLLKIHKASHTELYVCLKCGLSLKPRAKRSHDCENTNVKETVACHQCGNLFK
ncbi:myoneurin-like [Leptidea sinapis]|uniref:myoneurin-like n=1 Tax=Leptidea sinapis TaxID=189913 RepID=UPI0021C33494|nr:myoneurin-like [Leptidea sinapis]